MVIEELATYAESQAFSSVFRLSVPTTPDACIVFLPYGGRPSAHQFGSAALKYEYPSVQVYVRGAPNDAREPYERAGALYAALAQIQVTTLGSVLYHTVQPLQPPTALRQDERARYVYVFNLAIEKEL